MHLLALLQTIFTLLLLIANPATGAVMKAINSSGAKVARQTTFPAVNTMNNTTNLLPAVPSNLSEPEDENNTYNPTFQMLTPLLFFLAFLAFVAFLVVAFLLAQRLFQRHDGENYEMLDYGTSREDVEESVEDWLAAMATAAVPGVEVPEFVLSVEDCSTSEECGGDGVERRSWSLGDKFGWESQPLRAVSSE
ncbi:hypothetical protein BJ508DRAFT_416727 [Ascobolus immersus RN42]|uniref:Transmembrane protein n=1 Tax=Ascobolus immersus RN42 TaxID=1160509 RepID=A0A3N4I1X6_ASCIM|nr:hypothetical protein BJ508DRAFT_416727 [Ascobolus immersus RN42]